MTVHIGESAPDFTLISSQGNSVNLSDFKGRKIVLYFFPKSDTPGCTKQSCSFKDAYDIYKEKNIVILGINYDYPKTLEAFRSKYNLPFILLSDSEKKVSSVYGAYSSPLNILYPKRITFLINENGVITDILNNVNVTTHAQDIIDLI